MAGSGLVDPCGTALALTDTRINGFMILKHFVVGCYFINDSTVCVPECLTRSTFCAVISAHIKIQLRDLLGGHLTSM